MANVRVNACVERSCEDAPPTRWTYRDPRLAALFPLTYFIHLCEEFWSAAPIVHWGFRAARPLNTAALVSANSVGLTLMVFGLWLAHRDRRFRWVIPGLACAVLFNSLGHIAGSAVISGYSAGLATSVILWTPLGLLTLLRVWDQSGARMVWHGVAVGAAIEGVVTATLTVVGSN